MSPMRRSLAPKQAAAGAHGVQPKSSWALKEAFLKNQYPSYQDRLRLAARLTWTSTECRCGSRTPGPSAPIWNDNRPRADTRGAGHAPTDPRSLPGSPPPAPESAAAAASSVSQTALDSTAAFLPQPRGRAPRQARRLQPPAGHVGPGTGRPHVYGPAAPSPAPAPGWPQDPDALNSPSSSSS